MPPLPSLRRQRAKLVYLEIGGLGSDSIGSACRSTEADRLGTRKCHDPGRSITLDLPSVSIQYSATESNLVVFATWLSTEAEFSRSCQSAYSVRTAEQDALAALDFLVLFDSGHSSLRLVVRLRTANRQSMGYNITRRRAISRTKLPDSRGSTRMHVSHVCLSNLNRSRSAAYPYLYQGMNSSCATVNPLQIATNPHELIQ